MENEMSFPFFTGIRKEPYQEGHKQIPSVRLSDLTSSENYDTEEGLVNAVNVALLLGQPLFLTGEPGTGKTLLAYRIAWELGFDDPLKFETKSNSEAKDLFYYYNSLARIHDAYARARKSDVSYITYNALGTAIIRSHGKDNNDYEDCLPPEGFEFGECRRSIVLIDEIDKAPRDFPNDILNEIENMYFRIPELDNQPIKADPEMKPVVVITSNQEKHLPDAFLRRCVFYHIQFPDRERMRVIVEKRLKDLSRYEDGFLSDAINLFYELRSRSIGLKKMPSTAELLGWLIALRDMSKKKNPLREDFQSLMHSIGVLIKYEEDDSLAKDKVTEWYQNR